MHVCLDDPLNRQVGFYFVCLIFQKKSAWYVRAFDHFGGIMSLQKLIGQALERYKGHKMIRVDVSSCAKEAKSNFNISSISASSITVFPW
jgi:hypothetical protein